MIEFSYIGELEKLIEESMIDYPKNDLFSTKGLAVYNSEPTGIINLSAFQWFVYSEISENYLIEELSKSITHETVHLEIGKQRFPGEERVVMILANQLEAPALSKTKHLNSSSTINISS